MNAFYVPSAINVMGLLFFFLSLSPTYLRCIYHLLFRDKAKSRLHKLFSIIIPILHMKKQAQRCKGIAWEHTASKWWRQDFNACLPLEPITHKLPHEYV